MKRTILALAGTLALTGAAFATEKPTSGSSPGASGHTPGAQMKNDTSGGGTSSPGASSYTPGAQMKNDSTGSTSGSSDSSKVGADTKAK